MILKNKHLIFSLLLTLLLLITCSCKSANEIKDQEEPPESSSVILCAPDKITVGANGIERELFPDDEEYTKIVSFINERVTKSGGFLVAALAAHDPETEKHLSYELRKSETFVEFVYNECKPQKLNMLQAGGSFTTEEYDIQRIFFPLTRDYHDSFFVSKDADYVNTTTLGSLVDKTELITYVRDLVAQETASE